VTIASCPSRRKPFQLTEDCQPVINDCDSGHALQRSFSTRHSQQSVNSAATLSAKLVQSL
jgi:hypothetical protein